MSETIKGAGSVVTSDVTAGETFFEKNPKAIAIGSAIAGALLMFAVLHFF